jgi:glycopeptide antibiotics resistance protein
MRRFLLVMLLLVYLVVLFALALRPSSADVQLVNIVPLSSIVHGLRAGGPLFVINIIGNIVVSVPLGIVLPNLHSWFRHWFKTLIIGIALSAVIEALQF